MHHLADSTDKLCKGGKERCFRKEGVLKYKIHRKVCEPVIVCEFKSVCRPVSGYALIPWYFEQGNAIQG